MTAILSNADVLSELLVAQLLEEDLRDLEYIKQAERLQLDQLIADSSKGGRRIPKFSKAPSSDNEDIAVRLMVEDARLSSDALYAQALQHSTDVNNVASLQLAQSLAAAEKKIRLDEEFARRLQEADDGGEIDTDDINMRDAESVLGTDRIESIMASDMNSKGKGRGKRQLSQPDARPLAKIPKLEAVEPTLSDKGKGRLFEPDMKPEEFHDPKIYPTCGICLEPFQVTYSPLKTSLSANSSSRLSFGTRLPCPSEHAYCLSCLSHYIKAKLEPEEDGVFNTAAIVFPIRCPECPKSEWEQGIPDEVAERLLDEKSMVSWHHQKLLDSLPRNYCPNPRCSTLFQVDEDSEEPQASCPACKVDVCIPCKAVWHDNMTCEEYQALPLDERSPDDQLALQLAKAQNWRRCPNCAAIVELTQGCHHITCRCKAEFCFKCGSSWDTRLARCMSNPPCDLWDENMLLDQRERAREARVEAAERRAMPALAHHEPPPYAPRAIDRSEFAWLSDPNTVCARHPFTADMLSDLTCGYCNNRLNSIADLQYHLSHVRYHSVFACCGKLFKREIDYDRHCSSNPGRFGMHIHQIERH